MEDSLFDVLDENNKCTKCGTTNCEYGYVFNLDGDIFCGCCKGLCSTRCDEIVDGLMDEEQEITHPFKEIIE